MPERSSGDAPIPERTSVSRRVLALLVLVAGLAAGFGWRVLAGWWFDDLGNLALAKGDATSARALFERGLAFWPDSPLLIEDRGRALLDSDPAAALRDFERANCGAPCLAEMGDAYARLGDSEKAVADYLDARAANRLAAAVEVIAAKGDYDRAIALETALAHRIGDNVLLSADLAAAYAKIGKLAIAGALAQPTRATPYHRMAIAAFDRASAIAPYNEGYLLSLGFAQGRWGDKRVATAVFKRVLALHPHQADAERALAELARGAPLM